MFKKQLLFIKYVLKRLYSNGWFRITHCGLVLVVSIELAASLYLPTDGPCMMSLIWEILHLFQFSLTLADAAELGTARPQGHY